MKRFLRLLVLPLALILSTSLQAEQPGKDPDPVASELRKNITDLRKDAHYRQSAATEAGRSLGADEQKYVSYTLSEAEMLEKCLEAWEKNQKRLAEKYRFKAGEFCQKRGEVAQKLGLWEKKSD
jgi:hypothetical protein